MADKISKDMTFFEVMRTYPESVTVSYTHLTLPTKA